MEKELDHNIFLIGFMGVGKSTIAAELQNRLGGALAEMDQMIVDRQGMSIADIFEKYGEEYFRDLETELLKDLRKSGSSIVSCGGGAVLRPENVEIMKQNGRIVLLTAKPGSIYERVRHDNARPILQGNMNVEYIAQLMEKRRECYEQCADLSVSTDGNTVSAYRNRRLMTQPNSKLLG